MMTNPLVSVVMITYGHEKFISEAIKGVFMQKTDFPVEFIIANDHSPDNSDIIIKELIKTAPRNVTVKYHLHEKNLGMMPNFIWALQQANGKYIALCEGDDYWTNEYKLQKQVDFLEANPDYSICFHNVKIITSDQQLVNDFITQIPANYEQRETLAINNNYIHTPTVLLRNILQKDIEAVEFRNSPIGDYFLYLMVSQYGKIGHIDETMSVYRYGVGVFSALSRAQQKKSNMLLFTNLFSWEKNTILKEHFYQRFLAILTDIEFDLIKKENLLNTRRNVYIEKLYKRIMK